MPAFPLDWSRTLPYSPQRCVLQSAQPRGVRGVDDAPAGVQGAAPLAGGFGGKATVLRGVRPQAWRRANAATSNGRQWVRGRHGRRPRAAADTARDGHGRFAVLRCNHRSARGSCEARGWERESSGGKGELSATRNWGPWSIVHSPCSTVTCVAFPIRELASPRATPKAQPRGNFSPKGGAVGGWQRATKRGRASRRSDPVGAAERDQRAPHQRAKGGRSGIPNPDSRPGKCA